MLTDSYENTEDESLSSLNSTPAAVSDTGCERELNEDRYAVIESNSGTIWMVCDGMGGAPGGELAAQLAIEAIRRELDGMPANDTDHILRSVVKEANRVIVLRRQNQAFAGMGTTIVAAFFSGQEVAIGHAGDSRAYLIRDGAIQQLTTDHTYVQQLVDQGKLKPEDALAHQYSHVLTKCIGSEPGLEIDVSKFWIWPTEPGELNDYLVLCSDGLYSLVGEGELANIITSNPPQKACSELVELARSRGGFDNITMIIIPLEGQLKDERPENVKYHISSEGNGGATSAVEGGSSKYFWVKWFLVIIALAVIFSALTLLLTLVFLAK